MSISATTLTETSVAEQAQTLKDWLDNNAKGVYFSDVVMADGVITCYIGEDKILEFGVASGNNRCKVYIKHENTRVFSAYSSASGKVFKHLVRTDYGLMVSWLNYSSSSYYEKIFISKTDRNSIGVVMVSQNSATNTTAYVGAADFDNSTSGTYLFQGKAMSSAEWRDFFGIDSYSYSSLCPISITQSAATETPSYLPYVYFYKQCQDKTSGIKSMILNGVEFFSDGQMAMRG